MAGSAGPVRGTECERILGTGIVGQDFFHEEERSGFRVGAERKKVWAVELDLLVEFSRVCERLGLTWWLAFGSLLGAMRHGGFIPWDDDVDVFMPRADYDRLLADGPAELSEPYLLQTPYTDPGSCFSMARMRNTRTSAVIEPFKYEAFNQGCLIDIAPLDETSPELVSGQFARALDLTSECSALMRWHNPEISTDDLRNRLGGRMPRRPTEVFEDINANARWNRGQGGKLLCCFATTPYDERRQTFLAEDFSESVPVAFEGIVAYAPVGWNRVLMTTYGDWRTPPPAGQRGTWHGNVSWDPDAPSGIKLHEKGAHLHASERAQRKSLSSFETRRVQLRLLEMGSAIADVLEREGIPYSLALGTLLGGVRHRGFIPWDDDFDLWLFDDSYDDAIAALRSSLPEDMFVEDGQSEPLYFHGWAHVKDVGSVARCERFPQDGLYTHKGVSVDLYRLTKVASDDLGGFISRESRDYLRRRYDKGLIDPEDLRSRMDRIREDDLSGCWDIDGPSREVFAFSLFYQCKHIEVGDMIPLSRVDFEGRRFFGPADADAVLRGYYGDWRKLPAPEDRIGHYSEVTFAAWQAFGLG